MWKNDRRRSASSATAWGIALVGFAGLIFWYLGWLPFSIETPEAGSLAENSSRSDSANLGDRVEEVKLAAAFDAMKAEGDFNQVDPAAFESQSEPPVEEPFADDPPPFEVNSPDTLSSNTRPGESPFGPARSSATYGADARGSQFLPQPGLLPERTKARPLPLPNKTSIGAAEDSLIPKLQLGNERPRQTSPPGGVIVQTGGELPVRGAVPAEVEAKLRQIDGLLQEGRQLVAHRELSTLYWIKPDWRPFIKDRIERTASSIYFSPQPHFMQPYEVQPGDLLQTVAKPYNVPWEYLVRLNRIDPRRIRPGQKLKVLKGPFSARIDLSDFELTIHAHGYFVRRYRVGIGRDGSTPIGKFKVMTKLPNPAYYGPNGNVVAAEDPNNPLGERWIDIGDSYGIHGTIEPKTVGQAVSRGCIRMLNSDVEEVYDLLGVGSEVVILR